MHTNRTFNEKLISYKYLKYLDERSSGSIGGIPWSLYHKIDSYVSKHFNKIYSTSYEIENACLLSLKIK